MTHSEAAKRPRQALFLVLKRENLGIASSMPRSPIIGFVGITRLALHWVPCQQEEPGKWQARQDTNIPHMC